MSLIPYTPILDNNYEKLISDTANSWKAFNKLTTCQRTKLYEDTELLNNNDPDKITEAILNQFKGITQKKSEKIGVSIGTNTSKIACGPVFNYDGAYLVFQKITTHLQEKKRDCACLLEVNKKALEVLDRPTPELIPDIKSRLIMESFMSGGSRLHEVNKTFSQKFHLTSLVDLINSGRLVTDFLNFKSLDDLAQFLGEENCSKVTSLCTPDYFLFENIPMNEKISIVLNVGNPHLIGRPLKFDEENTPFIFKFSNNGSLSKFPNLKTLSFRSFNKNCHGLILENLNYDVDLNSLQSFPNFKYLTLSSSKIIDLIPLKKTKIIQLNLYGDQFIGLDNLSECQSLKILSLDNYRISNFQFLLNIPNLSLFNINQYTCSMLLPEMKYKLYKKDILITEE